MRIIHIACLTLLLAGPAQAGSLDFKRFRVIDAPADKVWALVGEFTDTSWIPGVARSTRKGDGGSGIYRTTYHHNGQSLEEILLDYNWHERSYTYTITVGADDRPFTNYVATLKVEPIEPGKSLLQWTSTMDPKPGVTKAQVVEILDKFYNAALAAAAEQVEE